MDWHVRTISEDPELAFIVNWGPERFGSDVGIEPILPLVGPVGLPEDDWFSIAGTVEFLPEEE